MLAVNIGGGWGAALPADGRRAVAAWGSTLARERLARAPWGQAGMLDRVPVDLAWEQVPAVDRAIADEWGAASTADAAQASAWNWVPAVDGGVAALWGQRLRAVDLRLRLIYNPRPAVRDTGIGIGLLRVDEYGPRYDAAGELQASLYVPGPGPLRFNFGGRPYFPSNAPRVFFDFRYTPPARPIQPVDSGGSGVRWGTARRVNHGRALLWGRSRVLDGPLTGIEYPDYSGPVKPLPVPPADPTILDTYMIANTVNMVVLPSRTPIEAKSVRLSLDADSFSWKFSADIFTHAALDLVRPNGDGGREVEVEINGHPWVLVVERYSRQNKFATEAYTITGATRSQLLAAPYAPARTALNNAPITARQAADAELLNTGFSITWDAENTGPSDWTFPAGAFSYQGQTAMQVIARIAETVGAIVRPAQAADVLEVRPRYPVPPWEWDQVDAPIERIIPPAMLTDLNGEWTPQPAWNACYVSGTSHGASMLVRRAGTAGDNPTADVFDDWITGQEANRARGVHELSKGGNIEIVGFTLPLFPAGDDHGVGLVLPGMLCRVPEETGAWVGLCLSVDIVAEGTGASRVQQQLKLERHH